jgi:hypothetical protein
MVMNYVMPLLLVGVLAGGAGYASIESEDSPMKAGLQAPVIEPNAMTYAAHAPGVDSVCLIKRIAGNNPQASSLKLDADCADVFADLSKAVSWLDHDDGSAAIVDQSGKELLVLGPSDGFAYESNTPGAPIVTLTALGKV